MRQIISFNNKNWALPTLPHKTNAYIQFPESSNFSSSAYFITDLLLKDTYTIEIKFKTASNGSKWRLLAGVYESYRGSEGGWDIQSNANNRNYIYTYWSYGEHRRINNDYAFPISDNTEYLLTSYVGTGDTILNGTSYSGQGNNVSGTLTTPFQICNVRFAEGSDAGFNGKIYYIKVTEGNTLIAYIQADNTDNIPGFIDTVSGTKYTEQHNKAVTYGEDA